MLRIWKGIEVECNKNLGNMTLFVETNSPDLNTLAIVTSILETNRDIKTVYFGAGEVDILDYTNLDYILHTLKKYGKNVVIESSSNFLPPKEIIDNLYTFIIRHTEYIPINAEIKIRTENSVYIKHLAGFNVNILNLTDKQYTTDVTLYEGE